MSHNKDITENVILKIIVKFKMVAMATKKYKKMFERILIHPPYHETLGLYL